MENLANENKSHNRIQGISELLTYVEQDAVTSRDCLEVGVMTKTAKRVSDYLTDPAKAMLLAYNNMGTGLTDLVGQIVYHYLSVNKGFIKKAYKFDPTSLCYYIILEQDDFATKERFFQFLEHYDSLEFAYQFPVTFQFIPNDYQIKLDSKKEIRLN